MADNAKFITLEGLEGVGKTTNREYIETLLSDAGIEHIVTREPGGTKLGEQLRHLLLHADAPVSAHTELMMMAASRKQHIIDVIQPALDKQQWVLCDRFADASFAYQGGGREIGLDVVAQLHEIMQISLEPDLTLLLDMPIEAGLKRMAARGKPDRIEKEALDFFERARAAYLQRANDHPQRIKIINADQSLDAVQAQVLAAVKPMLDRNHG